MASGQVSPKVGKVIDIPANAPTIGTATDLAQTGKVSVPFTAGSTATGGPVFYYRATSNPGSITGTATSSPITVSGLTDNTAYTFTVAAVNPSGAGQSSAASNSVTPTVQPTAFDSIATTTATGGEASLSFTSIPSGYTHLQIRAYAADSYLAGTTPGGSTTDIRFNGDTGNNYTQLRLYSDGTTIDSAANAGVPSIASCLGSAWGASNTNLFSPSIIDIYDYSKTTKTKSVKGWSGVRNNSSGTNQQTTFGAGVWLSTSAITQITMYAAISGWRAGSTFALYGVK